MLLVRHKSFSFDIFLFGKIEDLIACVFCFAREVHKIL